MEADVATAEDKESPSHFEISLGKGRGAPHSAMDTAVRSAAGTRVPRPVGLQTRPSAAGAAPPSARSRLTWGL